MRSLVLIALLSSLASVAYADDDPRKVGDDIDRTLVDRAIQKRMRQIRACYEKALTTKPKLEGKVTIQFRIERAGNVTNVRAKGVDDELDACIVQQWRKIVFPKSAHPWDLTYPVVFKRAD